MLYARVHAFRISMRFLVQQQNQKQNRKKKLKINKQTMLTKMLYADPLH